MLLILMVFLNDRRLVFLRVFFGLLMNLMLRGVRVDLILVVIFVGNGVVRLIVIVCSVW